MDWVDRVGTVARSACVGVGFASLLAIASAARAECDGGWTRIDDDTQYRCYTLTKSNVCTYWRFVDPSSGQLVSKVTCGDEDIHSNVWVTKVAVPGTTGLRILGASARDRMQSTSDFARQYDCNVAVNGSFFSTNGNSHSRVVASGQVWGAARPMTDTSPSRAAASYVDGYFMTDRNNHIVTWSNSQTEGVPSQPIPTFASSDDPDVTTFTAVPGPHLLVHAGRRLVFPDSCIDGYTSAADFNRASGGECTRSSRTAIGTNKDRSFAYFVSVDGDGATISDVAEFMRSQLNVDWAVNLDGGGSSAMVLRHGGQGGQTYDLVTRPRDYYPFVHDRSGTPVERAIAFNFGLCRGRAASTTFFTQPQVWYWWHDPVDTFTASSGWGAQHLRTVGDVNGDGFVDIVAFGTHSVYVVDSNENVTQMPVSIPGDSVASRNTRTSFGEGKAPATPYYKSWTDEFSIDDGWGTSSSARFVVPVDWEGAGQTPSADLLGVDSRGNVWTALSKRKSSAEGGGFEKRVQAKNTQGAYLNLCSVLDPISGDSTRCWDKSKSSIEAADMNGDGLSDIVVFGRDGTYLAYGVGCSGSQCFFVEPKRIHGSFGTSSGWSSTKHVRALANVTTEKHLDLVGYGNSAVLVVPCNWHSDTSSCTYDGAPQSWLTTSFTYDSGWRVETHERFVADVDGDGDADLVGLGNNAVIVSRADRANSRFLPSQVWLDDRFSLHDPYEPNGWNKSRHVRIVTDVSGDGRADILGFGESRIIVSRPE